MKKLSPIVIIALIFTSIFAYAIPLTPTMANPTPGPSETREVSQAVQLTTDAHYDRDCCFLEDEYGTYWLFFTRGRGDPTAPGYNPDTDFYDIYYLKSTDGGNTWTEYSMPSHVNDPYGQREVAAYEIPEIDTIVVFFTDAYYGDPYGTPTYGVYYTYTNNGGASWSSVREVPGVTAYHIDVLNAYGKRWLFYEGPGAIIYVTYYESGVWSTPIQISESGKHGGIPKAMIDDDGNFNVVWCGWTEGGIYRSTSADGITWSTPELILTSSYIACDPMLVQDSTGTYWLFWAPWDSATDSQWLEVIYSTDGTTWSSSIHVTSGGYGGNYWWDMWPEAYVKPDGNMLLFYTSEASDGGAYAKGDGNIWMFKVVWDLTKHHYEYIQNAIDAASAGDTIKVYEGMYTEQITINKSLTLIGDPKPKIVAPDARTTFTIPESGSTFDPIVFAYGSLTGTETINVTITGFEIDGGNKASAYPIRFVGILCRNVKPAVISNNVVHSMYPPSGKGSGPETCAILVYGDSEAEIYHNEVRDFSRVGIGVLGDAGPSVDPVAVIQENEVFGNGLETETGWWAENGIQVAYGASGYIVGNEVFNCTVNNPNWASTGILVVDTDGVTVDSNYVEGCDVGIGAVDFPASYGPPWDYAILSNINITGNTLIGNAWQIDISNDARNITVTYNAIINATANGIDVWSYSGDVYPTNVRIHYNNIEGSGAYGIWASDELAAQPVDARFNWWGDPTGPYHATSWTYMGEPYGPHYGLGDNVTDYVLYDPWEGKTLMRTEPEPISYQAKRLNETFSVNVTIQDVDAAWKIIAIQFRLTYNSTLLQLVNVTEGPFMKQFGDTFFIVMNYPDDPLYGTHVAVGILLLPNATGQWETYPEGSGLLATITFKVIYQHVGLENPPLTCNLTLIDTILVNEKLETIAHRTEGSRYEILPNNIGDINWDYKVDIRDIAMAAAAFGTFPEHERWNPAADITGPGGVPDGKVDIRDLALIAANYGWVPDPDP